MTIPSAPEAFPLLPDPRVTETRARVERFTEELARLLAARDELRAVVGPNLEADYRAKVGVHLLANLRRELELARLRRELELVQAAVNRGESPDYAGILRTLDAEFAAWRERLAAEAARLAAARARLGSLRSAEESAEFRQLYRLLVRRPHPDVHPDLPDVARHLWARVQDAHDAGDLDELRDLAALLDALRPTTGDAPDLSAPSATTPPSLPAALLRHADALAERVRRLPAELAELQRAWPFPLRGPLADPAWVTAQVRAAEEKATTLEARRLALRAALDALLDRPPQQPPATAADHR